MAAEGEEPKESEHSRTAFQILKTEEPDWFKKRTVDAILVGTSTYTVMQGLLYRPVYDSMGDEIQLGLCVPDVISGMVEIPRRGLKAL